MGINSAVYKGRTTVHSCYLHRALALLNNSGGC